MSTLIKFHHRYCLNSWLKKNSFPALYYQYLKMIFEINGYDGIGALPKESLYSKPRVTRCRKKITLAVFEQFSNFAKREIL